MDAEIILPQPDEIEQRERERALASYFMMFISATVGMPLPFINLIASWVYYSYTKKTSRFVKFHSLQSLISQLPVTLLNTSLVVWMVVKKLRFKGSYYINLLSLELIQELGFKGC